MRIHMRSFDASELEMLVTDPREPKFTHFPVSHSSGHSLVGMHEKLPSALPYELQDGDIVNIT